MRRTDAKNDLLPKRSLAKNAYTFAFLHKINNCGKLRKNVFKTPLKQNIVMVTIMQKAKECKKIFKSIQP